MASFIKHILAMKIKSFVFRHFVNSSNWQYYFFLLSFNLHHFQKSLGSCFDLSPSLCASVVNKRDSNHGDQVSLCHYAETASLILAASAWRFLMLHNHPPTQSFIHSVSDWYCCVRQDHPACLCGSRYFRIIACLWSYQTIQCMYHHNGHQHQQHHQQVYTNSFLTAEQLPEFSLGRLQTMSPADWRVHNAQTPVSVSDLPIGRTSIVCWQWPVADRTSHRIVRILCQVVRDP